MILKSIITKHTNFFFKKSYFSTTSKELPIRKGLTGWHYSTVYFVLTNQKLLFVCFHFIPYIIANYFWLYRSSSFICANIIPMNTICLFYYLIVCLIGYGCFKFIIMSVSDSRVRFFTTLKTSIFLFYILMVLFLGKVYYVLSTIFFIQLFRYWLLTDGIVGEEDSSFVIKFKKFLRSIHKEFNIIDNQFKDNLPILLVNNYIYFIVLFTSLFFSPFLSFLYVEDVQIVLVLQAMWTYILSVFFCSGALNMLAHYVINTGLDRNAFLD